MDPTECGKSKMEETMPSGSSEDNSKPSVTSNTYLESLGLVLNNGKPRFKLDEPVTTALDTSAMNRTSFSIDDEDDLSFVVLGKNSIDTIQASSLASYVDIQQKSMSIDYNSMLSSLTGNEIQQKLTHLLQENVKLKETLKQNNVAMKKQFNTLATWQEEVMKVHQNHKQKFAETTEFINHLKKENTELRIKLSAQQADKSEHSFEAIHAIPESNITSTPIEQEKICLLTEELDNFKLHCEKLKEDIEKYKSMLSTTDIQLLQAKQLTEEQDLKIKALQLELAMESTSCNQISAETTEIQECLEVCSAKDQEITRLQEEVARLLKKYTFTLIELHDPQGPSFNENRQKFAQSVKQYNNILQELTECFTMQIDRFTVIEKCLKEIIDVLEILDKLYLKSETIEDDILSPKTKYCQYRQKLCNSRKELVEEQIKIITDRQVFIKSQDQFQKMLSDYKSILYELEITIDENAKLNALKDSIIWDSSQKQAELEKAMCNKQSLEEEKKIFDQEKDNLEEERKLFGNQKRSLEIERKLLFDEKELLEQEKISLNEEKISLDHQSQLYENQEKTLQEQKKSIQRRYEELLNETNSLREDIQKKDIELKELQQQSTEEMNLLKMQLKLYEEDFKQEKNLKESLLEEKSKLDVELQKQVEFNKQLQQDIRVLQGRDSTVTSSQLRSERTTDYSNQTSEIPPCLKCNETFVSVRALTEHIERCLNLN